MKRSNKVWIGVGVAGALGVFVLKRLYSLQLTIQTKMGTLMDMRGLSPWQVRNQVALTLESVPKDQIVSIVVKGQNGSILNLTPNKPLNAA
jgi:hypothetical protein